jgi:hypothetical protein
VQRCNWHADGNPDAFGVPVGRGGPISRLSPLDAPNLVLRHFEFRLRFEGNVRGNWPTPSSGPCRATWAPATVSLRSVNFPDRHVRVVAGSVPRIDPFDGQRRLRPGDELRAASPGLADARRCRCGAHPTEPRAYLAHDGNGRLVVTRHGSRPHRTRTPPRSGSG